MCLVCGNSSRTTDKTDNSYNCKLLRIEFLQLRMHTLSMVSERKRQKGEVEGEKVKETESATIGSKTFCVSQNLSAFSLHFRMTIVKKVLKKQTGSIVHLLGKKKEKKKRTEILKAIFKGSYLKFWQSREPNYYMSFF